jgi:hypothetical protein
MVDGLIQKDTGQVGSALIHGEEISLDLPA